MLLADSTCDRTGKRLMGAKGQRATGQTHLLSARGLGGRHGSCSEWWPGKWDNVVLKGQNSIRGTHPAHRAGQPGGTFGHLVLNHDLAWILLHKVSLCGLPEMLHPNASAQPYAFQCGLVTGVSL